MPLYIKNDETAALVSRLARLQGRSKQDAVKHAVQAALDKATASVSVRQRLQDLWAENPLPPRTGKRADKAFFDDLSGKL